jgi:hypothetical protein
MTAIVEIGLGEVADAVLVPRSAVVERDGGWLVYPRATWPRPQPVRPVAVTAMTVAVASGAADGWIRRHRTGRSTAERGRMTLPSRRRILTVAVPAVLLLAAILALGSRRRPDALVTAVATRGELVIDVATVGQVEAVRSRSVSRQRTGFSWDAVQIAQMAPEGSVVKEATSVRSTDHDQPAARPGRECAAERGPAGAVPRSTSASRSWRARA